MRLEPPLRPDGDDARSQLRRELLGPAYQESDLVERVLTWLRRRFEDGTSVASDSPPLTSFAAMLIGLGLVLALGWLVSRARRSPAGGPTPGPVLTGEQVSAEQLRARAQDALDRGEPALALVEAFRALTARQVERGVAPDAPGATAHEVALVVAHSHPRWDGALHDAADLFDRVLYGGRPATSEQARAVLSLDDELVGVR